MAAAIALTLVASGSSGKISKSGSNNNSGSNGNSGNNGGDGANVGGVLKLWPVDPDLTSEGPELWHFDPDLAKGPKKNLCHTMALL